MAHKKFRMLRIKMMEADIDQAWIAQKLNRSVGYISMRFTGRGEWTISECCAICKLLKIPLEELHLYFVEDPGIVLPSYRNRGETSNVT